MTEKGIAWSRGSLTVEMAGLMPAILLVVFGVISLCFYVHNKCFLTAGAYEAALSGTLEEHRPEGEALEAARRRAQERGDLPLLGMEQDRMQVSEKSGKLKVSYRGAVPVLYGGLRLEFQVEGSSRNLKPEENILRSKIWR